MRRKLLSALLGIGLTILVSAYVGYLDVMTRSASRLQQEGRYAESTSVLERLMPLAWIRVYREDLLIKLAINYREMENWEQLRQTAEMLENSYAGSVSGSYGTYFYGSYLARGRSEFQQALAVYEGLLASVRSKTEDDDRAFLRQSLYLEVAWVYQQLGQPEQVQSTIDQLRNEYPHSPYRWVSD